METISKLDGAKRRLDEAIKLFFESRDPLIIHTLDVAAQGRDYLNQGEADVEN